MSTAIPREAPTGTASDRAETSPDVQLTGVSKAFKDVTVVDDLDLAIERGRFYALLGPSGCGKTTTLRMIGGFEEPTAGRVLLGGEDVTTLPPHKRDVNTVFQSYALFPHLSVEKNVAFGLQERKVSKHDTRARVAEALETVQLSHLAKRKPAQLSGGQAQRVALARALVNKPRALLLDEPLGALDLRLRRQLQLELKAIQQDIGITFVHVTHDQEEAMTMADTIAVMNAGRIEQAGSAQELYERPETAFVANFLGVSNLIPADVTGRDGEDVVLHAAGGATLRATAARLPEAGATAVRAGVRPEKVQIGAPDQVPGGANVLRGQLVLSSYLGVSLQHVVRCADGLEVTVICQNVEGEHAVHRAVGTEVAVWWDPRVTFLVEAGTESAAA